MPGKLRLRYIPRRLRRVNPGPILPRIAALLAAALLLSLFFSLVSAGGKWANSIDTAFFRTVLSAELGSGIEKSLSVFSRSSLVTSQSAILSGEPSYPFEIKPDDGFDGNFPEYSAADKAAPSNGGGKSSDKSHDTLDELQTSGSEESDEPVPAVESDPNVRTVTIIPSSTYGYDYADGVYIKNETSYDIDVQSLLGKKPDLDVNTDDPLILIVHTHASEAYYPDGNDIYVPTDTERTDDKNYNVIRVGDEMAALFEQYGYKTVHIREIFDYPSYTGSYTRTLEAIEKALEEYPTIRIVLDIHRDAIVSASGVNYRTVTEIGGKKAAQILLVVGTNEGGLKHENWKKNLTLAVHIQKHISESYPMLMRPINLRPERFNQHATPGSLIVEIGTSANTLQEALYSAELFTSSLCELLDTFR